MARETKIQWCDATFNPWRGCERVSAGCENCYAERWSRRQPELFGQWGPDGARVVASDRAWAEPLAWNRAAERDGKRLRVFCGSMCDVFEGWHGPMRASDGDELRACPRCGWVGCLPVIQRQLGPQTTITDCPECGGPSYQCHREHVLRSLYRLWEATPRLDWLVLTKRPERLKSALPDAPMPSNVWLGVSIEKDEYLWRAQKLCNLITCRNCFVSCEPLLGPVDLTDYLDCGGIRWVIVGGETGPGARPMHPDWARSIRDQCQTAGVPFFFKQWGEWAPLQMRYPYHRDELLGRRVYHVESPPQSYQFGTLSRTGEWQPNATPWNGHDDDGEGDEALMARVGKKQAGRLLDGREWNEFPAVGSPPRYGGTED